MDIRILFPTDVAPPAQRLSRADVEETLERMFAPPSVDAGQVPLNVPARFDSGEMRLALAVLEDALRCVLRHHDSRVVEQRMAAREALEWMRSDDDSPPFTFVRICQLHDLDPDWIRALVHRHIAPRPAQAAAPGDRPRCAA